MLPAPVSFTKNQRNYIVPLLNPPRPTNLVILLLLLLCCVSLLFSAFHTHHSTIPRCTSPALSATITRDHTIRGLKHLIIVPGHAIWKGGDPHLRLDDDQWILEPYQKSAGSVASFFAHIQRGYAYSTLFPGCLGDSHTSCSKS
jgi:hypothetical protein